MTQEPFGWLWYLGRHLAAGTVAAAVVLASLLASDASGLAVLVHADEQGGLAVALLAFGLWATFGGAALAAGIMGIGDLSGRREPASVRARSGWRSSR